MTDPPVSPPPRRSRALLWSCLVLLGVLALPVLYVILYPVLYPCAVKPAGSPCLSNVKQIMLGMIMYASDNNDHLPFSTDWPQRLLPSYVKNRELYICPSMLEQNLPKSGSLPVSYAMNVWANELSISVPSDTEIAGLAVLFDATQVYGVQDAAAFRHCKGLSVGFADGHAKWLRRRDFRRDLLNPPDLKVTPLPHATDLPPLPPPPKLP